MGGVSIAGLAALLSLVGCSGGTGSVTPPGIVVFPNNLPERNRALAGEKVNFAAVITNSAFRSPRFFVEKPVDEPTVQEDSLEHGTIDRVSGIYTPPLRLKDVGAVSSTEKVEERDERRTTDRIAVVEESTVNELVQQIEKMRRLLKGEPVLGGLPSLPELVVEDIKAGNDEEALRRLIAQLSDAATAPPNQAKKASVLYRILHHIVADPQTVDVSVRTSQRLADFIRVPGDKTLNVYDPNTKTVRVRTLGEAFREQPSLLGEPNRRVTFTIKDPLQGAGGTVDAATGVYTAPLSLSLEALNDPGSRRAKDIIVILSNADPERQIEIVANVVVSNAPTGVTIN